MNVKFLLKDRLTHGVLLNHYEYVKETIEQLQQALDDAIAWRDSLPFWKRFFLNTWGGQPQKVIDADRELKDWEDHIEDLGRILSLYNNSIPNLPFTSQLEVEVTLDSMFIENDHALNNALENQK